MIVMVIAARKIPPTGKTKGGQDICKNLFPPPPLSTGSAGICGLCWAHCASVSCHSLDSLPPQIEGHSVCITCLFWAVRAGLSRTELCLSTNMSQRHRSKQIRCYFTVFTVRADSSVSACTCFYVLAQVSGPCIKNPGRQDDARTCKRWQGENAVVWMDSAQHCNKQHGDCWQRVEQRKPTAPSCLQWRLWAQNIFTQHRMKFPLILYTQFVVCFF